MRIAVLGDLHYFAMPGYPEEALAARNRYFQSVLESFFEEAADYYVALGDLTHSGAPDEFEFVKEAVRERGLCDAFVPVLGNHELKRLTKSDVTSLTGRPRYSSIDRPEARLVFLDTSVERSSGGDLDEEQSAWFREQSEGTGAKPLLVFAHHPVYDTTPRSTEGGGRTAVRPEIDMRAILNLHRHAGLYVNGHIHINSIVCENNWSFVQTTSLLDVPGYRTIDIAEDELNVAFVRLHDPELEALRLSVAGHTSGFRFNAGVLGRPSDQTLVIARQASGHRTDQRSEGR